MPLHRSVDSPSEPMCTLRFTAPTTKPSRSSATVYGTGVLLTAVRATAPMASAMKRKYRATWPWTAWLPWPSDAEAAGASAAMTMAQLTEQVLKTSVQAPPRSNAVCLCLVTSRSPPQGDAPAQVKGPPCEGKRKQQRCCRTRRVAALARAGAEGGERGSEQAPLACPFPPFPSVVVGGGNGHISDVTSTQDFS